MNIQEYVTQMYAILYPMCVARGYYDVSRAMIAQSIQEGWNSGLATGYFNFWGMKASEDYSGETIFMNNKAGNDPAIYRVFKNMKDGCEGYFKFLEYKRYRPLHNCKTDIEYLDLIGPCGWNSNPGYGDRCKKHLKTVYDILNTGVIISLWEVGKTYTTQQDLNIRSCPSGDIVPFENLTEDAQKHAFISPSGFSVLRRNTRVTVREIKVVNGCTWLRIPSGWICGNNSKNIYVI